MSHLWSGRFDSAPNAEVFAFGSSFSFDRRLFEDDVRGSLAWADAIHACGVLSHEEHAAISAALLEMLDTARATPGWVAGDDEDVHSFVERQLIARVGNAGRRLHTGRSRNEQVSLDLRLYLRRRIPVIQEGLVRLIDACVHQASMAGSHLLPSYTHLRRAQPVLIAHFWLSHAVAFRRDHGRLAAARAGADAMPLGSGAIAGTTYGVDVAALAQALDFSTVVTNSLDATADRDFVADFLHACSLTMVHMSRVAEDVIVFGTEEFGFLELHDSVTTGSSLMPQKKNPDPMELVRGKTGRVIGRLTGWLATMKGLPSGYNKDLQEDKEAVFDAEDNVSGALMSTAAVVASLRMNGQRTTQAAGGFMLATDVADYLVARGMPFRSAHELVGGMVRNLIESDRTFERLSPTEWRAFSDHFDEGVVKAITAQRSVEAKRTPQSTAPSAVAAQLDEMRAWVLEASPSSERSR
jgi:argininosuccinate lyase